MAGGNPDILAGSLNLYSGPVKTTSVEGRISSFTIRLLACANVRLITLSVPLHGDMSAFPNMNYICPNGHSNGAFSRAGFCSQCGAGLVAASSQSNSVPQPNSYLPPAFSTLFGQSPANSVAPAAGSPVLAAPCTVCGIAGSDLNRDLDVCPQCRWLRPLDSGYVVPLSAFQLGADSAAMAKLKTIAPLTAAARTVSDRVGRRWVETSFNAIRLGEDQLPEIFAQGVRAARLLGMSYMPDFYVSGDKMWDAVTYGSDRSAFLLIGTALLNSYKGDDLLFLLAREMGHCRAGHALWKTVKEFLMGQHAPNKGIMSEGVLAALNPQRLVEGVIDVPFLSWARQAEITADRAGLLAVGSEDTARRVLLSWSLRSMPLYRQINIDAWLQQQEDSDEHMTRMAEMISSPTPFITRRLKLMMQFANSPELAEVRAKLEPLDHARDAPAGIAQSKPQPNTAAGVPAPSQDIVRVVCPSCGAGMRVPRSELAGKEIFRVRCPKSECGKVLTLQKKIPTPGNA